MTTTIVSDFDGTITYLPETLRNTIATNLGYIETPEAKPNWAVVARFGNSPVTIVTGRVKKDEGAIRAFCLRYGITIDQIYFTPARIWAEKDAKRKMQEHKARMINSLHPLIVLDDDETVLKMVEVPTKYFVNAEGIAHPFETP